MKKYWGSLLAALFLLAAGGMHQESKAAFTNADVDGLYDYIWFGQGVTDAVDIDMDTIEFDGAGGFAVPDQAQQAATGTYDMIEKGRVMVFSMAGEGMISNAGAISPDASIIAIPETLVDDHPGYNLLVQRDSSIGPADLAGKRYNFVDFSYFRQNGRLEVSAGYMQMNDRGTSMIPHEQYNSVEGDVDKTFDSFPFTVEDGYLRAGNAVKGIIGTGGDFLAIAKKTDGQEPGVVLMFRSKNVGERALHGFYHLTSYTVDTTVTPWAAGADSGLLYVDGKGGWSVVDGNMGGTYQVDGDGRLLLNRTVPVSETITWYGAVSPDGQLFILPEGNDDELGFTLAVKLPPVSVTLNSPAGVTITTQDSATRTRMELQEAFQNVPVAFQPMGEVFEFEATVSSGTPSVFTYVVSDLTGSVGDLTLLKLKENDDSLAFTYAEEAQTQNPVDGMWWITRGNVYQTRAGTVNHGTSYTIHFAIEDNGDYDLDPATGTIRDPAVLGTVVESPGGGDGSESSGCFIHSLIP
ncbi:hypothetical protein OOT00_05275 [Desulfobotulus sp. H1]|uniref:Uncharacterized protein n=1 Tax=Desulfobotulus pelophilus TaxID=2823377 RepID=A0ABT3N7G5_9BACT|nr:hypothetical protein [Desulfobotulus pelophilus]MCW7753396.1 hypothetical protein [Desulfobotulus pelophilus]